MLKTRIIPTLLWKEFGLVKGIRFNSWRRVGSVLPTIKIYNYRELDELLLVDIIATKSGSEPDYESIKDFSQECFIPLTVGGGIKNIDQVYKLLREGADKVVINTAAYQDPRLITQIANRFGSQSVIASVDVRKNMNGGWDCFSHSGQVATDKEVSSWVRELESRGSGEILITSIDRDGTMTGYDLPLIELVANNLNIPVIASGGAGNYDHMVEAIKNAGADAVAAASMFHFTEQTPGEAKKALLKSGIPVRANFPQFNL